MTALSKRLFACLSLAAIGLQAAIPAGFMPTNLASGWYVQLCPNGMSAELMAAVFGDEHHHHHHGGGDNSSGEPSFECDLAGFSASFAGPGHVSTELPAVRVIARSASAPLRPLSAVAPFRSRAPPVSRQSQLSS